MNAALALALCSLALLFVAPLALGRRRWQQRAPRASILLWQAIGASGCLAAIGVGAAVSVSPMRLSVFGGLAVFGYRIAHGGFFENLGVIGAIGLTMAVDLAFAIVACLVVTAVRTTKVRGTHRRLLELVGTEHPRGPDVVVLESSHAIAYCVPGRRARIVVSKGAADSLAPEELDAVLEHERGHVSGHHELVMLPFSSVQRLFTWVPFARVGPDEVAGLAEMAADDFACRTSAPATVASALVRLLDQPPGCAPSGAFAATATLVSRRVERLADPGRVSKVAGAVAFVGAVAAVALPFVVMAITWPRG